MSKQELKQVIELYKARVEKAEAKTEEWARVSIGLSASVAENRVRAEKAEVMLSKIIDYAIFLLDDDGMPVDVYDNAYAKFQSLVTEWRAAQELQIRAGVSELIVDANLDEKEADRQLCKFIGAKITEALEAGESDPNGTVLLADMTIYVTGNYQWEKSLDGKTKQKHVKIEIY